MLNPPTHLFRGDVIYQNLEVKPLKPPSIDLPGVHSALGGAVN